MKLRMGTLAALALVPILALTGCGSDSDNGTAPDTTPPLAPIMQGARADDGAVGVWWSANNEPDLAGYNVYITQSGVVRRANSVTIHQTSFVTTLVTGGSATVYVTAVDHNGNESSPSADRLVVLDPQDQIEIPNGGSKVDQGSF